MMTSEGQKLLVGGVEWVVLVVTLLLYFRTNKMFSLTCLFVGKSMTTLMCKAIRLNESQIDTASRSVTAIGYQAMSLVSPKMPVSILC